MNLFRNSILNMRHSCIICMILLLEYSRQLEAFSIFAVTGTSNKLAPIYWNTNNKNFYDSTNSGTNYYLKLNAQLGDSIDLVCPTTRDDYSVSDSESLIDNGPNQAHYLNIYKVGSKFEFDNCIIDQKNKESVQIFKCDKPFLTNPTKFTIFFVRFSPVPGALEFEEEKEYYFLSTSSGDKNGMEFTTGGLCSQFNMRFSIKINSVTEFPLNRSRFDSNTQQVLKNPDTSILAPNSDEQQQPGSNQQLLAMNASDLPQPQVSSKLNLISSSSTINLNLYFVFFSCILIVFCISL